MPQRRSSLEGQVISRVVSALLVVGLLLVPGVLGTVSSMTNVSTPMAAAPGPRLEPAMTTDGVHATGAVPSSPVPGWALPAPSPRLGTLHGAPEIGRSGQSANAPALPAIPPALQHVARATPAAPRVGSSPPNIDLGGTAFLIENANTTVGNISLNGNATLYVNGAPATITLTILGNVYLSQNATFYVNGSNLLIRESYDVEWGIYLTGASRFDLYHANVTMDGFQWGAEYADSANVTIIDSYVGYPSGWVDSDLIGSARLALLDSWYSSDVILYDSSEAPSTSNFSAAFSVGFNIWLNFKSGTEANLSLPGLDTAGNWTFPGTASVSGVNYTVDLYYCIVSVFAVMLWQGANLTLSNSPDVAISLNVVAGAVTLDGLSQSHYTGFNLSSGGFTLQLRNTSVFTWNIYPFGGTVEVAGSQVGEIQVFNTGIATVRGSNLTADGGYYGEQGSGALSIFDSTIAGEVVGYSGFTQLENCTIDTPGTSQVLATGTGRVYSLNTSMAVQDSYHVLGGGSIDVAWPVSTIVSLAGAARAGVAMSLRFGSNLTLVDNGTTGSSGVWGVAVVGTTLLSNGSTSPSYIETAAWPGYGATTVLSNVNTGESLIASLSALVVRTSPENSTVGVSDGLGSIVISFAFPMMTASTAAAVTVLPVPTGLAASWDASAEDLTLTWAGPLAVNATFQVRIGAAATTADEIPLGVDYVFSFQTAPAPLAIPAVTSVTPSNGSNGVSVNTTVTIRFSIPMDDAAIELAFSLTPAAAGTIATNATTLVWTPTSSLSHNTTYDVTLSTAARSAAGEALSAPLSFSFRTAALPVPSAPPQKQPSSPSSTSANTPWTDYALIALGALALVAVLAALFFWRRGRQGVVNSPPTPATAKPSTPAPWDEDDTAPRSS